MAVRQGYSGLQIGLHWLIAVLIVVNWFTGEGAGEALDRIGEGATDVGTPLHVPVGVVVFLLVLVRIVVKLLRGGPNPPGEPGSPAVLVAKFGHLVLYVLMVAVPLGGMAVWFGGMTDMGEVHELAGNALFFIALLHALVALYHQYVVKDRLLLRMMRPE